MATPTPLDGMYSESFFENLQPPPPPLRKISINTHYNAET